MDDFFEMQMELFRRRMRTDLRIEPHPLAENDYLDNNPVAAEISNTGFEILNVAWIFILIHASVDEFVCLRFPCIILRVK